jgi:hypothetical protein
MQQETRSRWATADILGVTSGCLYAGSFLMPVGRDLTLFGWQAFVCSAIYFLFWPMWAANPVFWFGLVKAGNQRWEAARNAGVLAMMLAVSEAWMFLPNLGIGYYCWLGSMIALAAAGAYGVEQERGNRRSEEGDETAIQILPDRPAVRVSHDTGFVAASDGFRWSPMTPLADGQPIRQNASRR